MSHWIRQDNSTVIPTKEGSAQTGNPTTFFQLPTSIATDVSLRSTGQYHCHPNEGGICPNNAPTVQVCDATAAHERTHSRDHDKFYWLANSYSAYVCKPIKQDNNEKTMYACNAMFGIADSIKSTG